jgi:hypothetical protein
MNRKADILTLVIPKDDAPPAASAAAVGQPLKEYTHTVSLRQSNADYRRLARFCADESDRTGQRVTRQMVIETALARYFDERGG